MWRDHLDYEPHASWLSKGDKGLSSIPLPLVSCAQLWGHEADDPTKPSTFINPISLPGSGQAGRLEPQPG